MAWFTYVLECSDGSLYCGVTTSLERRLDQHNKGTASRYTRARRPVRFVASWPQASRSAAQSDEAWFKSLARAEKNRVVATRRAATASIESPRLRQGRSW
jgi:putative endonuclease